METFIKVYIKSEDDLPKEDIYYFVHDNNYQLPLQVHRWLKGSEQYWLEHIDWYLKPVEIPEITDEGSLLFNVMGEFSVKTFTGATAKGHLRN